MNTPAEGASAIGNMLSVVTATKSESDEGFVFIHDL